MATRTLLACPNCQANLDVRSERLGSELECKRCYHRFIAPRPADDGGKVDVKCPGCHRELKVRTRYLGLGVVCSHCEHGFLARPETTTGAKQAPPEETEELHWSIGGFDQAIRKFESDASLTVERLDRLERLSESATLKDSARDSAVEQADLLADQHRLDVGSVATDVATLRLEVVALQDREEAHRRDFQADFLGKMAEYHESSRLRHEAMGTEIEAIRARDTDLERRAVEAEERAIGLATKLGLAEESARAAFDRLDRLEASLREVEANRAVALGQFEQLLDRVQTLRTEHLANRETLTDHEGRHEVHQSGMAKLEALGFAEALGRLSAVEAESRVLSQASQSLEHDQGRSREESTALAARTRADLADLLARLEAIPRLEPAAVGPILSPPEFRAPVETNPTDLDLMAEDLVINRLVSPGVVLTIPLVNPTVPAWTNPNVTSTISETEFSRLGDKYAELMTQKKYDEAIKTARSVVDFTQDHTGDLRLDHALWLRNLGVALLKEGDQPAARTIFHRALEISQDKSYSNRAPHAICLLDLGDSYYLGGDWREATGYCETAIEVLKAVGGPDHPLNQRAVACLHRIKDAERPTQSPTETVSVMA